MQEVLFWGQGHVRVIGRIQLTIPVDVPQTPIIGARRPLSGGGGVPALGVWWGVVPGMDDFLWWGCGGGEGLVSYTQRECGGC